MNASVIATSIAGLGCLPLSLILERERRRKGVPVWERWLTPLGQLLLASAAFGHELGARPVTVAAVLVSAIFVIQLPSDPFNRFAPCLALMGAVAVPLALNPSARSLYALTPTLDAENFVVFVVWLTTAVVLGGAIVERVLSMASTPTDGAGLQGLLNGGRVIGWLERACIFATVIAHEPSGIAVVIAVKSVARFPEFRAPSTGETKVTQAKAEAFIVGTLLSVALAVSAAYAARFALT